MVDLAAITMIREIVTIIGVIAGLSYYIISVRNQNRAREAQLMIQISQILRDKEFRKDFTETLSLQFQDYDDFIEKYNYTTNFEVYLQRVGIWYLLNTFGHILKRGLVASEIVYDTLAGAFVKEMWDRHSPIILEMRVQDGVPLWMDGFEYLADEMNKIFQRRLEPFA